MPMTQPPADLRGNLCHIAPEREAGRGQKVWFVSAPYGGDVLRFRGEPTSLLYAIAPLVERIRRPGRDSSSALAKLDYHADLAFLNPTTTSEALYAEIEARLRQQDLKLLCISVMTASSQEGRRIAALAKKVNPSTVVVFGGPHENQSRSYATAIDPEFRQIVDFSIRGDGEESLLRLAEIVLSQDSRAVEDVKAAVLAERDSFRACRGIGSLHLFHVDQAERLPFSNKPLDLDAVPAMPRELLCEEDTRSFWLFKREGWPVKTAQIMTHRGCAWQCSFCSESAQLNHRTVESVLDEVESVLNFSRAASGIARDDYGAVFFDDSTFTAIHSERKSYLTRLFEGLKRLGVEWGCQTRLDQIQASSLQAMAKAGCTYIFTGMESANDDMLWSMKKEQTRAEIERGFDAVNAAGIRLGVSLVFGAPRERTAETLETKDTIRDTVEFLRRQAEKGSIVLVSPNVATYYPGSQISRELRRAITAKSIESDSRPFPARSSSGEEREGLSFRTPLVNRGYPWNRFEEGEGQHAWNFGPEEAEFVLKTCIKSIGEYLVSQDLIVLDEYQEAFRRGLLDQAGIEFTYLNHASITSVLEPAREAAEATFLEDGAYNTEEIVTLAGKVRQRTVEIGGPGILKDRVVLARNTTEATSLVYWLAGLTELDRSTILTSSAENLSIPRAFRFLMDHGNSDGRDPWSSFQDFGVRLSVPIVARKRSNAEVEVVDILGDNRLSPEQSVLRAVDEDTDLIVFSHVVRDDGYIMAAADLCADIRKKSPRTKILIDGAQALGAVPAFGIDHIDCDFYVAAPHKTLGCLPLGLLFVTPRHQDRLHELNAMGMNPSSQAGPHLLAGMLHPGIALETKRLEAMSAPELAGFLAAIKELERRFGTVAGIQAGLNEHRAALKDFATDILQRRFPRIEVVSASSTRYARSILSVRFPREDNRLIVERLWRHHRVFVSYIARSDVIRLSLGPDTAECDIMQAVEALEATLRDLRG